MRLSALTLTLPRRLRGCALLAGLALSATVWGAPAATDDTKPAFELVALGVEGGLDDGNLSAWLARANGDARYLDMDAGTLLNGIEQALRDGAFGTPPASAQLHAAAGTILRERIAGYFISHPHLDHVGGLAIAATDDTAKPIYGLASTLDALSQYYFNWTTWPNFADRGTPPALHQYTLTSEAPGQWFDIAGTSMQGLLLPLQHGPMRSSMLLLRAGDAYLAFFGDTGADAVQHSTLMAQAWKQLAPLLRRHALRGIVIESSYPNDIPDEKLFGHLTPHWLLRELHVLAADAGPDAIRGLPVVIGHIKPSLQSGRDTRALIGAQLDAGNDLHVPFILPTQGEHMTL